MQTCNCIDPSKSRSRSSCNTSEQLGNYIIHNRYLLPDTPCWHSNEAAPLNIVGGMFDGQAGACDVSIAVRLSENWQNLLHVEQLFHNSYISMCYVGCWLLFNICLRCVCVVYLLVDAAVSSISLYNTKNQPWTTIN